MKPTSTTIHRDVHSLAKVIADFKTKTAATSPRFTGVCGFDGFIDTFVRLLTPPTMAEFGPKVAAAALKGLDDAGNVLAGNCASGHYVRSGRSAAFADMSNLLDAWATGTLKERL